MHRTEDPTSRLAISFKLGYPCLLKFLKILATPIKSPIIEVCKSLDIEAPLHGSTACIGDSLYRDSATQGHPCIEDSVYRRTPT